MTPRSTICLGHRSRTSSTKGRRFSAETIQPARPQSICGDVATTTSQGPALNRAARTAVNRKVTNDRLRSRAPRLAVAKSQQRSTRMPSISSLNSRCPR